MKNNVTSMNQCSDSFKEKLLAFHSVFLSSYLCQFQENLYSPFLQMLLFLMKSASFSLISYSESYKWDDGHFPHCFWSVNCEWMVVSLVFSASK